MQQQQGQDIGRPASNLVVKVTQLPAIPPSHWGFVLTMRSPTRACGFVWKYLPLFWNAATTTFFGMLQPQQTLSSPSRARWLTGLLLFYPFLQMATANLCSHRNRHLRTQTRCRSTRTARRRYLRFRTRAPQQSRAMASCTLLFPLAFPFFFFFPFQALRPASFLVVYPL